MILRGLRKWITLGIGLITILMLLGYMYAYSNVRYWDYCLLCGQQRAVRETGYVRGLVSTTEGPVSETPISEALAHNVSENHDHEWSRWVASIQFRSLFNATNGRGIGPRTRFEPLIIRELEEMPNPPLVWRRLLELEKHSPDHFRSMLVGEFSYAGSDAFSLQKWWYDNHIIVEEVLVIESDAELKTHLLTFLNEGHK